MKGLHGTKNAKKRRARRALIKDIIAWTLSAGLFAILVERMFHVVNYHWK